MKRVMKLSYEPIPGLSGGLFVRLSGNLEINGAMKLWDIGTLVRLLVRLRGYGGSIAIFGCSDKICEVFEIVMLREILHVCDNEAEARDRLLRIAKG
jgi:hypothetical protein